MAPSLNHVYADRDGNIAWFVAGSAPIRPNWDGLPPVPGDGRYEWAGVHRFDDLPSAVNPRRGFVATANEMNLPPDYPYREKNSASNGRNGRARGASTKSRMRSRNIRCSNPCSCRPTISRFPARRLGAVIATMQGAGDAAIGLDLLRAWDFHLARDSAAGALFEVWWMKHLKPALLDLLAPDPALRALLAPGDAESLLALLERPDHRLRDRETLLATTARRGGGGCRARMGPTRRLGLGKSAPRLFRTPSWQGSRPA